MNVVAAVDQGWALLDERRPNWRKCVNPDAVNMMFADTCVLGQVFGDFYRGLFVLGLSQRQAIKCGFAVPFHFVFAYHESVYADLTAEWKRRLREPVNSELTEPELVKV